MQYREEAITGSWDSMKEGLEAGISLMGTQVKDRWGWA